MPQRASAVRNTQLPAGVRANVTFSPLGNGKGNGGNVVACGQALRSPDFAEDHGEEPELVGCYLIDDQGRPHRLGFAIGNEFSDHVTERRNYLLLAHSKLRQCGIGPMLNVGALPAHLEGTSRIRRDGHDVLVAR